MAGDRDSGSIAVRRLLNHTSGFSPRNGFENWTDTATDAGALARNVRRLSSANLLSPLGAAYHCSNANYDVLGFLPQVVSGINYEKYVADRIFRPLGIPTLRSRRPSGIVSRQALTCGSAFRCQRRCCTRAEACRPPA